MISRRAFSLLSAKPSSAKSWSARIFFHSGHGVNRFLIKVFRGKPFSFEEKVFPRTPFQKELRRERTGYLFLFQTQLLRHGQDCGQGELAGGPAVLVRLGKNRAPGG